MKNASMGITSKYAANIAFFFDKRCLFPQKKCLLPMFKVSHCSNATGKFCYLGGKICFFRFSLPFSEKPYQERLRKPKKAEM